MNHNEIHKNLGKAVRSAGLFCTAFLCYGATRLSIIRSRGVAAIQGIFMYCLSEISVRTTVSVRYRAGVRNSGVSVRRGSTVLARAFALNLLESQACLRAQRAA